MLKIITGDLLNATEKYMAHQCNCTSSSCAGVAHYIFEKFPYSDTYSRRVEGPDGEASPVDAPGTIDVMGNGTDQRYIINMYAQYYPGVCRYPLSDRDGVNIRKKYFHRCLAFVSKIPNLESVAFPWRIGCGLAGGDWEWYLGTLKNFADHVEEKQGAKVIIYRREGDE